MRITLVISLMMALLASPAWATGKCCSPRVETQTCKPLVKECCGEFVNTCAIAKYAPGCPPAHQCLETFELCCPSPGICPPPHQPLEFACISECPPNIKPVCHKPVVLLTLVDACGSCGESNCTDC